MFLEYKMRAGAMTGPQQLMQLLHDMVQYSLARLLFSCCFQGAKSQFMGLREYLMCLEQIGLVYSAAVCLILLKFEDRAAESSTLKE